MLVRADDGLIEQKPGGRKLALPMHDPARRIDDHHLVLRCSTPPAGAVHLAIPVDDFDGNFTFDGGMPGQSFSLHQSWHVED
ncbi:MAG: hypothetical protein ABI939_01710 [Anaerolineaceae bacterium]